MIKIIRAEYDENFKISCFFSDGSRGVYDMNFIFGFDTVMVNPLKREEYFKTFFLDMGAVCWKNGFELSPSAIQQELDTAGQLIRHAQAA